MAVPIISETRSGLVVPPLARDSPFSMTEEQLSIWSQESHLGSSSLDRHWGALGFSVETLNIVCPMLPLYCYFPITFILKFSILFMLVVTGFIWDALSAEFCAHVRFTKWQNTGFLHLPPGAPSTCQESSVIIPTYHLSSLSIWFNLLVFQHFLP